MTQVYVIAGLIIVVSILICIVFIRQTITKRQKEKQRLHRALDKRAKDLVQMLNAFPPNFLPNDLLVFLYRCIVDVYEQLCQLDPDEPEYVEHFKAYTINMETALRAPKHGADIALQSSSQINEIRQYLNYLGRFMQKWAERGNISSKQYSHYKDILKKLITQLMVDNYILSAKQAVQMDKAKLAVHYYTLGKSLLDKEGIVAPKQQRLTTINEQLKKLMDQINREQQERLADEELEPADSEEVKEWDQFEEEEDWKKKNVYD